MDNEWPRWSILLFTVSQLQVHLSKLCPTLFSYVNYNFQIPMPTGFWLGSAKGKLGWRTEDKQEKKLFLLVPVRIAPAPVAANQGPKPLWLALPRALQCLLGSSNSPTVLPPLQSQAAGTCLGASLSPDSLSTCCNAPAISSPAKMYPS